MKDVVYFLTQRFSWRSLLYVGGGLGCGMVGLGVKQYVFSSSLPTFPKTFTVWRSPLKPWRVHVSPPVPTQFQVYSPLQHGNAERMVEVGPSLPPPQDPRCSSV